jgi:hypothetical protein
MRLRLILAACFIHIGFLLFFVLAWQRARWLAWLHLPLMHGEMKGTA